MCDPNAPLPHEVLASDEYWANPIPGLSTLAAIAQVRELWDGIRHHQTANTIGRYVRDMTVGFTMQSVPDGQQLPIPEDGSRQVLKVVEDSRDVYRRKITRRPTMKDAMHVASFDETANLMAEQVLYFGARAKATLPSEARGYNVSIRRTIYYLRASRNENFLAGLLSDRFSQDGDLALPLTEPLPVREVGVVYKGERSHSARRIISAVLLEPTGVAWPKRKDDDHDDYDDGEPIRVLLRRWFPTPLPAPGY